jgi:hypothetical protein
MHALIRGSGMPNIKDAQKHAPFRERTLDSISMFEIFQISNEM